MLSTRRTVFVCLPRIRSRNLYLSPFKAENHQDSCATSTKPRSRTHCKCNAKVGTRTTSVHEKCTCTIFIRHPIMAVTHPAGCKSQLIRIFHDCHLDKILWWFILPRHITSFDSRPTFWIIPISYNHFLPMCSAFDTPSTSVKNFGLYLSM